MKEYIIEYGVDDVCELGNLVGRPNCSNCQYCKGISTPFMMITYKGSYETIKIKCNYERTENRIS